MKIIKGGLLTLALSMLAGIVVVRTSPPPLPSKDATTMQDRLKLPDPVRKGSLTIEETLQMRRSVRSFSRSPLTLREAGQLLWAAQGVTSREGFRTAPSAGALYPLELYLVASRIEGLEPGIYRYEPRRHELLRVVAGDRRAQLARAALDQDALREAPAILAFTAVVERTTRRYRDRGIRYVHMEAGHAAQNVCLQAVGLGLGSVVIGAFSDDSVRSVLGAPAEELPLYLVPVGRP